MSSTWKIIDCFLAQVKVLASLSNMYRSCATCGGRFQDRYWNQHTHSTGHKLGVLNNAQETLLSQYGCIIRSTNDRRWYDILFPSLGRRMTTTTNENRVVVTENAEAVPSTSISSSGLPQLLVPALIPFREQQQQPQSSCRGENLRPVPDLIPIKEAFFSTR